MTAIIWKHKDSFDINDLSVTLWGNEEAGLYHVDIDNESFDHPTTTLEFDDLAVATSTFYLIKAATRII